MLGKGMKTTGADYVPPFLSPYSSIPLRNVPLPTYFPHLASRRHDGPRSPTGSLCTDRASGAQSSGERLQLHRASKHAPRFLVRKLLCMGRILKRLVKSDSVTHPRIRMLVPTLGRLDRLELVVEAEVIGRLGVARRDRVELPRPIHDFQQVPRRWRETR